MLTINQLTVSYQSRKEVVKDIHMELEPGKTYGLVGLNGAGKTTLLNTLYGFIKPEHGFCTYNKQLLKREQIAYLEAENYFYPHMTGYEYLQLFPDGKKPMDYDKWSELFSIPLREITESYSTGMRKKLALLAVLKQEKPILMLDEPFNGLDLESVELLSLILEHLRSANRITIITSHILESLTKCCDQIYYLADGMIRQTYGKEEFEKLGEFLSSTIQKRTENLTRDLL